LFFAAGAAILGLAPGNAARAAYVNSIDKIGSFHNIAVRIWNFLKIISDGALPTIVLLIISYHFADHEKVKKTFAGYWIAIGITAIVALFASPLGFITRTFFTMMSMFFAAFCEILKCIDFKNKKFFWNSIAMWIVISYLTTTAFEAIYSFLQL
jgi:hypothetical protein